MYDRFEKPYAYLVGEVDSVLSDMVRDIVLPHAYDWDHVRRVMDRLRAALERAEDLYIEQDEAPSGPSGWLPEQTPRL